MRHRDDQREYDGQKSFEQHCIVEISASGVDGERRAVRFVCPLRPHIRVRFFF